MTELWKPIGNGKYEVSSLGNVRVTKTGRIMKPYTDKDQMYDRVDLYEDGVRTKRMVHSLVAECISSFGTPEDMEQMLLDLTPIRVRIRKLTPTECLRLMDVRDDDIEKMKGSGLSNSALYKLAGNSIVCACLEGIFTQLFKQDQDTLF